MMFKDLKMVSKLSIGKSQRGLGILEEQVESVTPTWCHFLFEPISAIGQKAENPS